MAGSHPLGQLSSKHFSVVTSPGNLFRMLTIGFSLARSLFQQSVPHPAGVRMLVSSGPGQCSGETEDSQSYVEYVAMEPG